MTRQKFIPISISTIWFLTPVILTLNVMFNSKRGIYGTSDAVFIPIFGSVYLCAVGFPFLLFFAWSARNRCQQTLRPWAFVSTPRQWLVLLLFIYLALALSVHILMWLDWNHIPIALCYAATLAWLIWIRPYASRPFKGAD
jgi:hypothetical protein